MLESLIQIDQELFLKLNSFHSSFFDAIMWQFSNKFFWIPLYIWFLYLLFRKYPDKWWVLLLSIAIMILVSDQLCNFTKDTVMRLRPSNDPGILPYTHILKGYTGGMYGFYSSHASNAFAVALFMITSLRKQYKYIIWITLAFATVTAYSRIYLGVHYPGDVLVGSIAGTAIGTFFGLFYQKLYEKMKHKDFNTHKL